jgi:hypothetical protein
MPYVRTRRRALGDVMPYATAAAAAQQAVTPPWYYMLFPPAAGGYVIKSLYDLLKPIPGSQKGDMVMNAVTGRPTDAQIDYNRADCVQQIQNMRAQGYFVPAGAENQCASDQQGYVNLIGGTANDVLKNVIPSSIDWTAILTLGGIGLGIYLVVTS